MRKLLFIAMMCGVSSLFSQPVLKWELGESKTEKDYPQKFISAEVPGAVQLDFAKAMNLPDYRYGTNSRKVSCDYYIDDRAVWTNAFDIIK